MAELMEQSMASSGNTYRAHVCWTVRPRPPACWRCFVASLSCSANGPGNNNRRGYTTTTAQLSALFRPDLTNLRPDTRIPLPLCGLFARLPVMGALVIMVMRVIIVMGLPENFPWNTRTRRSTNRGGLLSDSERTQLHHVEERHA